MGITFVEKVMLEDCVIHVIIMEIIISKKYMVNQVLGIVLNAENMV